MTQSPTVENVVAELRARIGSEFDGELHLSEAEATSLFALIESQRATIERQAEAERAFLAQLGDIEVSGWQSAAHKMKAVLDAAEDNERAAEARVTALEEALKPFAKAAEDCDVGDDIRIGVVKPADVIWESAAAASITFGHLNTAAQALSRSSTEVKNDD